MNEFTMIGFLSILSSLATGLPLSEYYNRKEAGLRDFIEGLSDDELEQLAEFLSKENPELAKNLLFLKDEIQTTFNDDNDAIKKEMIVSTLMNNSNNKQLNLKYNKQREDYK